MSAEREPLFSSKNVKLLTEPLNDSNPITVQVLGICSALAVTVISYLLLNEFTNNCHNMRLYAASFKASMDRIVPLMFLPPKLSNQLQASNYNMVKIPAKLSVLVKSVNYVHAHNTTTPITKVTL